MGLSSLIIFQEPALVCQGGFFRGVALARGAGSVPWLSKPPATVGAVSQITPGGGADRGTDRPLTSLDKPSLGIGVLSWKAAETLDVTLRSHVNAAFDKLFEEQRVLLQESDEASRDVVRDNGYTATNLDTNIGILGGFEALGQAMESDIILLTENDFPMIAPVDAAASQIRRAYELIANDEADIVLMRSRSIPGTPFDIGLKYPRYFPSDDAPAGAKAMAVLRRLLRPEKARRLLARSTCLKEDAPALAPFACEDIGEGFHKTSSTYLPWTNNPFMIRRAFFMDTLIAFANAADTKRTVNGFKNFEIELNCPWWRESAFRIVHAPGIFTHGRIGDRGY